ncbi:glutamate dehydrogenase, partial [archaeon]|nr:glutamate dehydrogenase [archaeon]
GGVAVSGLEMAQNSMRVQWTKKKLCSQLVKIMDNIHKQCVKYGEGKEQVNYIHGANIGGFVKVADAMIANGVF